MIEFFIAFRHIVERKFQSIFSILGVAIAMTVFIVSLTVSNGLEKNMINSLLTLSPHILIKNGVDTQIENYTEIEEKLKNIKDIKSVIPQINTQAIVKSDDFAKGVLANGISSENVKNDLNLKMIHGNNDIKDLNSILVGEGFAKIMGINVGDEISLVSAENKELKLIVRGIFKTGFLEYDANLIIIPLKTMQILSERGEVATEIGIKVNNPQKIENTLLKVKEELSSYEYDAVSWKQLNQRLLSAVQFEKFVLIAILSLLLIIACFTVSVILNMIVREKIKDIGILKSIGYTNGHIRNIFTIEGLIIGISGMIIASLLSPLILYSFKKIFKIYMSNSYYYLDELPLYISSKELLLIYIVAFIVVFISTIYPASRAAKMKPVEALKYE
ncbi:MAG: ABC transporter permease [Leptotrichiaceae bacterium]|nr:ABC transporter permease [Leptotrichiaceae bacterium]MBP6281416.1 ABC transporter permease [Leptotrichiaceae bacterium]MBP7100040.1 ABC transporter permease [Leptotrichiaceae bacterium]MBP7725387.1 ABC transporter permease [Leptotrichiaceae bacterium]MBP9628963.1 ABC transporter permease [Leptotrichiaceae bacterium]